MSINSDDNQILGVRVLIEMPHGGEDYYVKYEFIGTNWKYNAIKILPQFLQQPGVKIQTLHLFSSSHNLYAGKIAEQGNIWIDNFYFNLDSLV